MSKILRRVPRDEENSLYISQLAASVAGISSLPIGFIAMFSGSWTDNVTIPGWYKCDGNNGTVNLVDKFVRGAATSGGSGGSDDAVVVAHDHELRLESGSGGNTRISLDGSVGTVDDRNLINSEGVSGVDKNIPAYYALIFIQRIS